MEFELFHIYFGETGWVISLCEFTKGDINTALLQIGAAKTGIFIEALFFTGFCHILGVK